MQWRGLAPGHDVVKEQERAASLRAGGQPGVNTTTVEPELFALTLFTYDRNELVHCHRNPPGHSWDASTMTRLAYPDAHVNAIRAERPHPPKAADAHRFGDSRPRAGCTGRDAHCRRGRRQCFRLTDDGVPLFSKPAVVAGGRPPGDRGAVPTA